MKKLNVFFLTLFSLLVVVFTVPQKTFAQCPQTTLQSLQDLRQKIIEQVMESLPKLIPTPTHTPISFSFPQINGPFNPPPPTPHNTPSPSSTTKPQPQPQPVNPTPPATVSDAEKKDFIMNAINDYRRSKGLSDVATNKETCDFAQVRAQEIANNFSHDGFLNRANSGALPYPSYSLATENIATTSNYKDVVNMWIASPSHAANMEKDTPYVCIGVFGNYYAYEGWKP